jgi:CTP:molybdopterin cytidylyltransferase MocA
VIVNDLRPGVCGVLLAAGAGRRAGGPKALRRDPDGTSWLLRSIGVLLDGGCRTVVVVLGCEAEAARSIVLGSVNHPDRVRIVEAVTWRDGMGESLRAGLLAVPAGYEAVVVHLVDLPDVSSAIVRRMIRLAARTELARATYHGRPGHPVLIGSDHCAGVVDGLAGDAGARAYLDRHGVIGVECGDLATGRDQDW